MKTIHLPPLIEALPAFEVPENASETLTDLRACGIALDDVVSQLTPQAAPADWRGDASEAAGTAMTQFAKHADAAVAAFEQATAGVTRYLDQMTDRRRDWHTLADERAVYNQGLRDLEARIHSADASHDAELDAEAQRLTQRYDAWQRSWALLQQAIRVDEDTLIAVFGAVDTIPEADSARESGSRVDAAALLAQLRAAGNDPRSVTAWWAGLTPEQKAALMLSHPEVVGNTDGIPTAERDQANQAAIAADYDRLSSIPTAQLTDRARQELDNILATMSAVNAAEVHQPPVGCFLVLYQPSAFGGDGAAAIAYGADPDHAANTAVIVPGFTNSVADMGSQGQSAMYVLDASGDTAGNCVIAWMGYDAPNAHLAGILNPLHAGSELGDAAGVAAEQHAEEGGHLLGEFVSGLQSTHDGSTSHLTVIGHSYGSTTAAHAAADGMHPDDLVLVGSPGAGGGVTNVDGLHMSGAHVFVGSKDHDFVTWLGGEAPIDTPAINVGPVHIPGHHVGNLGLGDDPSQSQFGATDIDVDGGVDGANVHHDNMYDQPFDAEHVQVGLHNHTSYFEPGSDSVDNLGHIVAGQEPQDYGDVTADHGGRPHPAHDYLYQWAGDQVRNQVSSFAHSWPHWR